MKLERVGLLIFCLTLGFLSCNNDDDGDDFIVIEVRDRGEQQDADKDSLDAYLKRNYYNSDAFIGNPNPKIADLVITQLAEGETEAPADHTLLWTEFEKPDGKLKLRTTTFADADYEFYVLKLNEGGGDKSPTFADNVIVNYEGFTLDNEVFDSAVTPVDFDLTTLVAGWGKSLIEFYVSESGPMENGDGTFSYTNNGVGVMFLPSGLAYFNAPPTGSGIISYESLVFKFELFDTSENDHDGDGIPSYLEDLNGDKVFTVDDNEEGDDDTDSDAFPNYFDSDDDGDGIPTADELGEDFEITTYNRATEAEVRSISFAANEILVHIKLEKDGTFTGTTITAADSDQDGILDYLDAE